SDLSIGKSGACLVGDYAVDAASAASQRLLLTSGDRLFILTGLFGNYAAEFGDREGLARIVLGAVAEHVKIGHLLSYWSYLRDLFALHGRVRIDADILDGQPIGVTALGAECEAIGMPPGIEKTLRTQFRHGKNWLKLLFVLGEGAGGLEVFRNGGIQCSVLGNEVVGAGRPDLHVIPGRRGLAIKDA